MTAEVWMGYLIDHHDEFTVVQSPFVLDGQRVFGADSDATTLAVAAVLHRLQHDAIDSISVPEGMDGESLSSATGVKPWTWRSRLTRRFIKRLTKRGNLNSPMHTSARVPMFLVRNTRKPPPPGFRCAATSTRIALNGPLVSRTWLAEISHRTCNSNGPVKCRVGPHSQRQVLHRSSRSGPRSWAA